MAVASPARASAAARVRDAVVSAARGGRWWYAGVSGESRYGAYLAHQRSTHPGEIPLTEREFWVEIHREAESNPQGGCC